MPASFVAASLQYISMGINQAYCVNCNGNTISAWVYITDLSVERNIVAISVGGSASTTTSRASIIVTAAGALGVIGRATDADVEHNCYSAAGSIVINTWYHIVGVNDLVNDIQRVYINGVQSAQVTAVTFNAALTSNTNAYNSCIGAQDNGSTAFMAGQIHDVRVWSRVLTPEEIMTIYVSRAHDDIIHRQEARFLLSEGASGTIITSATNLGSVSTHGSPVNSPTYSNGVLESV